MKHKRRRPYAYNARRCRSGEQQLMRFRVADKTCAERRLRDRMTDDEPYAYWRLVIDDVQNPDGNQRLGMVLLPMAGN